MSENVCSDVAPIGVKCNTNFTDFVIVFSLREKDK